jgi:hypothetical protein
VIGATLCGCASGTHPGAGAPTAITAGPTVLGTATLPPLVSRVTPSAVVKPAAETTLGTLSDRIDQALAGTGDRSPAARLSIKPAAGYQLEVSWVLGTVRPDRDAPRRVRVDAVRILDLVRRSELKYGSVLLLATGLTSAHSSKTSVVVRAKYTHPLVRSTDWSVVSVSAVFGMCDDKPAVIAPAYR